MTIEENQVLSIEIAKLPLLWLRLKLTSKPERKRDWPQAHVKSTLYPCSLGQWFSNVRVHQNHLVGLLEHRLLSPTPEFMIQ